MERAGTGTKCIRLDEIGQRDSVPSKVLALGIKKDAAMAKDHESDACVKQ